MQLYDHQEAKASTLYNMICTNLELYNQKLSTLQSTREMIENISNPDEFNEWHEMYTARKMLKLDILEPHVSIIDIFNICYLFEYIVEHYQILLNTFKYLFAETGDSN